MSSSIFSQHATSTLSDPSLLDVLQTADIPRADYTIHDPSQIITIGDIQLIASTGQAQEDGYDCGLETWWRNKGDRGDWNPGQCLFSSGDENNNGKPAWIESNVPKNDGAFWAPELFWNEENNSLTMLYSVAEMDIDGEGLSCVGIAYSNNIENGFPNALTFTDSGSPLVCIDGDGYDIDRSIIDPSVFTGFGDDEGSLFLVTGGGEVIGTTLNNSTFEQIDGITSVNDQDAWISLSRGVKLNDVERDWVEAAYIHPNPDTGFYYLFVNWGCCCSGVDSTYNIRVGRSSDPLGPYLDKNNKDLYSGGGTLLLESKDYVIGPGHTGIWKDDSNEYISFHYYDERRCGNSWIAERYLTWDDDNWPVVGDEIVSSFNYDENEKGKKKKKHNYFTVSLKVLGKRRKT